MINMVQSKEKFNKAYGGGSVSSQTTANLIANAIMHQHQKASGIEETPAESEETYKPFSMGLKENTQKIHQSLGFQEAAPLPEFSNAIAVKPIVSKDELMESQNIKPMSLDDQSAKNNAVQKTLNLMRTMSGLAPKEATSSFVSQPVEVASSFVSQPAAASAESKSAV